MFLYSDNMFLAEITCFCFFPKQLSSVLNRSESFYLKLFLETIKFGSESFFLNFRKTRFGSESLRIDLSGSIPEAIKFGSESFILKLSDFSERLSAAQHRCAFFSSVSASSAVLASICSCPTATRGGLQVIVCLQALSFPMQTHACIYTTTILLRPMAS